MQTQHTATTQPNNKIHNIQNKTKHYNTLHKEHAHHNTQQ